MKYLDHEEMKLVLGDERCGELVVAAEIDFKKEVITFCLGNWTIFKVPFAAFEPSGDGTAPEFEKLEVIDWGQTIQLGEYEAAVDALLEEYGGNYESEEQNFERWASC